MKTVLLSVISLLLLAACAQGPLAPRPPSDMTACPDCPRPQGRPGGLNTNLRPPPQSARTVEEFDTTTAEQRAAAAAPVPAAVASGPIGTTIASLGDVTQPGFWLKTPLVRAAKPGRITYPATGKSAQVELIPLDGPETAGSQISLAAMRLIEAPLTSLPEIEVYSD